MSAVKRKLKKREIICHIEKGMANKKVSEKFGVSKSAIYTWMKNREKLFSALQETSPSTKKIRSCNYKEVDKVVYDWFIL